MEDETLDIPAAAKFLGVRPSTDWLGAAGKTAVFSKLGDVCDSGVRGLRSLSRKTASGPEHQDAARSVTGPVDLRLISGQDLGKAELQRPFPEDIIGPGQIAIVAAQYGRGKTPLTAHMALEAACGIPLTPLGLNSCSGPVVVLDAESNSTAYREMFTRLMLAAGIKEWPAPLHFWFRLDEVLTPANSHA